jgi:D-glycero-D-manno-heptose 1,7-bisphosphate phosphatase
MVFEKISMKALFLDRDGIINIEKEYLHSREDFEFIEGIFDTLRYAQEKGYLLIVITNQSGIGRGYYTKKDFLDLNQWMCEQFSNQKISISKVYYCPHSPSEPCDCRKPLPGMLHSASRDFTIDFKDSILIGDKESDITAGRNAGVGKCVLARSGHAIDESVSQADIIIDSIKDLTPYL